MPGSKVLIALRFYAGTAWQGGGQARFAMDDRGRVRVYFVHHNRAFVGGHEAQRPPALEPRRGGDRNPPSWVD